MNESKEQKVNRYTEAAILSLEMAQMTKDFERKKREVESLLTVSESKGSFDDSVIDDVFKQVCMQSEAKLKESTHVKSMIIYRDVDYCLHESIGNYKSRQMNYVIERKQ